MGSQPLYKWEGAGILAINRPEWSSCHPLAVIFLRIQEIWVELVSFFLSS